MQKAGQTWATGIKGTIDNAKLALSVGLSVSVRELPQPDPTVKVDADSHLTTADRLKELQQQDFILWYANKIMPKGADVDTDEAFTGDTEVIINGIFEESKFRSAPYFDVMIDGIETLNAMF